MRYYWINLESREPNWAYGTLSSFSMKAESITELRKKLVKERPNMNGYCCVVFEVKANSGLRGIIETASGTGYKGTYYTEKKGGKKVFVWSVMDKNDAWKYKRYVLNKDGTLGGRY